MVRLKNVIAYAPSYGNPAFFTGELIHAFPRFHGSLIRCVDDTHFFVHCQHLFLYFYKKRCMEGAQKRPSLAEQPFC